MGEVNWLAGTCIGFLDDAGCGLIYADAPLPEDGGRVVFVHFRDVEPDQSGGWQGLAPEERVRFVLDTGKSAQFHRLRCATGLPASGRERERFVQKLDAGGGPVRFVDVGQAMPSSIAESVGVVVLTGRLAGEGAEQVGTEAAREREQAWMDWCRRRAHKGDLLMVGCEWSEFASFAGWEVAGELVLLGCRFRKGFTLKNARVDGVVHLEGADFSGEGGASFRGLRARRLHLDFGVRGPGDFVWLNEMRIAGDVIIGGTFPGGIQVMAVQDEIVTSKAVSEEKDAPCFHALYIGKEFYRSQRINRTVVEGSLEIHGLCQGEQVRLEEIRCRDVHVEEVGCGVGFACVRSVVSGNVTIRGCREDEGHAGGTVGLASIDLSGSYIEGHLKIEGARVEECVNLDETTVERVARFSDGAFAKTGRLKMDRATLGRMVFDDVCMLYGDDRPRIWANPRFMLLQRERDGNMDDVSVRRALVREYVALKHLLGLEGQLRQEDEAFYNMRKYGHWGNWPVMLLFNHMFGWGVRLWNIVATAVVTIALFVAIYGLMLPGRSLGDLALLSVQAMFMAFFGEWKPKAMVGDALTWAVTVESIIGVVVVTVFVGAYVRKLLR